MSENIFLVTGGSRGIGAAISRAAARAGHQVLLSYANDKDQAHGVVDEIRAQGGVAEAMRANTGRWEDVAALFARADEMGTLKVMAYSGGITGGSCPLTDADPNVIAQVIAVNLTGAVLCAREAIARMSTARGGAGGAIVFLSSRATVYGSPNEHVWYAASKGGVDSLAIGLAREVGPQGIRVNAVSPGPIDTGMLSDEKKIRAAGMTALQRIGEPEEVASAVMYLASPEASFITGANLAVSGGR